MKTRALGGGCRHWALLAAPGTLTLASIAGLAYAQMAAAATSTLRAIHVAQANSGSAITDDSSQSTALEEGIVSTQRRAGAAAQVSADFEYVDAM